MRASCAQVVAGAHNIDLPEANKQKVGVSFFLTVLVKPNYGEAMKFLQISYVQGPMGYQLIKLSIAVHEQATVKKLTHYIPFNRSSLANVQKTELFSPGSLSAQFLPMDCYNSFCGFLGSLIAQSLSKRPMVCS